MADGTECKIINSSGQDIVVTSAIPDDQFPSGNAVISADQQLEILKTSSGDTVIKNGSSDTVRLDNLLVDQTKFATSYDLIISDSIWLWPLVHLPVVQQGTNGLGVYADQTVDGTNFSAMSQAFNFYQTISAYPASQLAQEYVNALQQSDSENAVDAFFKSTSNYKDVTLADIVIIENYFDNFPFVWAQLQASITYYLYGRGGTAIVFVGTLSLNKQGAVDITKPNSGYNCSFAPAINPSDTSTADVDTSKAVSLTYNNRAFVDDVNASPPKIALKGNFQLKRMFTNKPDDVAIIPAFTGTVNGAACTGINVPMYQY